MWVGSEEDVAVTGREVSNEGRRCDGSFGLFLWKLEWQVI